MTTTTLVDLERRIVSLEQTRFECKDVDECMRRARLAVESAGLYSAVWNWVPPPYYTWPLEQRAVCLQAPSIHHLCKSLLMENKKVTTTDNDPTNPRFVLVVIQYAATLNTKQLATAIRALRPLDQRLDDGQFDFRIASQQDNDRLTGYSHNSVTPFGLLSSSNSVPIVLSEAIVPLKFFWMGGGHVHLKLGMSVTDFCNALQPIVADISQPRSGIALSADLDDDHHE